MKLRIGLAGCGLIGRYHHTPGIRASRGADLVGVCGANEEEAASYAREMGIPQGYPTFKAMIEDQNIDAVVVGTPNFLHHDQVIASARGGKHVLCEKPMARTLAEAEEMVQACAAAGVTFMVGHHLRYKACNEKARTMITSGELGKLSTCRVQWSFNHTKHEPDTSWHVQKKLSGGGQMMNVNCHCVDLLVHLFGKARRVSAFVQNNLYKEVEDVSLIMIEFQSGVLATAQGSYSEEGTENNLELFGDRNSLVVTGACSVDRHGGLRKLPGGEMVTVEDNVSPYTAEIDHFAKAIRERFEPISGGRSCMETMRILMAAYRSAEAGTHVELST